MSTLSLADLGPKMRQQLGLESPCRCITEIGYVAFIPVIEIARRPDTAPISEPPGAAWLRTGLHRLRVPAVTAQARATP